MRIGIITDAHANLPALQTALSVLSSERCDLIVHTGDAVAVGPHPREVVETLLALDNAVLLQGNHDEYAIQGPTHPHMINMDFIEREHQAWVRDQLPGDLIAAMTTWPHTHELDSDSASVFFCHYARTPDNTDFAPILRNARPDAYDRLFDRPPGSIVFHGHDHPKADIQGASRYVIPGALGVWQFPQAHIAILTLTPGEPPDLRLRSIPYDGSSVLRDLDRRQVPARDFLLSSFYGITG